MKQLLLLSFFLMVFTCFNAQTILPASEVQLTMEPVNDLIVDSLQADTLLDPLSLIVGLQMNLSLEIVLQDTVNTDKILFIVGRTAGGVDIVDNQIDFDGTPPSGITYERDGMVVWLGLGNYSNTTEVHCSVTLEDDSGNASTPTTFVID